MAQRADRVIVSRGPVVDHAVAGELVVLGLNLIVLRPINQVHDLVDVAIRNGLQKLAVFGLEDFARNLFQHVCQCHPHALELLEMIRIGPRPARILDLFLSGADIVEIAAPTEKRISPALMRSKSTSRSSVLRNGEVSYQLVASTVPGAAR